MESSEVAGDERTTKSKILETGAAMTQVSLEPCADVVVHI